jgi:hypothetical protein
VKKRKGKENEKREEDGDEDEHVTGDANQYRLG